VLISIRISQLERKKEKCLKKKEEYKKRIDDILSHRRLFFKQYQSGLKKKGKIFIFEL